MKKRSSITALAFALLLASSVSGCQISPMPGQAVSSVTADARFEDLDYLYETLSNEHFNLFANTPREEFEQARAGLEERIPNMTDVEFYHGLEEFTALAGDSHTAVTVDQNRVSKYAFQTGLPFALVNFGDAFYLAIATKEYEGYLGAQVTAIDGVPIDEVYERASALISHDNEVWLASAFPNTINFIDVLNYIGVADSMEEVTLRLLYNDETVDAVFKAMSEEEIMGAELARLQGPILETYADGSIYRAFELNDQVLFIQYNACMEDPEYPFADFVSDVNAMLDENTYEKIIVDMRYNSGGNSAIWEPMAELLRNYIEPELYCLIGTDTFSSGILNAIQMKNIGATLVGSPTGGSLNHFGEILSFTLPNSPITVYYSTNYFESLPGEKPDSLRPDILAEPTLQAYIEGVDEVVEAVLND